MTEMEMLKEFRSIIAAVAGRDRRAGQRVGTIEQVKATVRAELVSTVKERFGGYLDEVKT